MSSWGDESDEVDVKKIIMFDVGGMIYYTTFETLSKYDFFQQLFKNGVNEYYFFDRDGFPFFYLLSFMRTQKFFFSIHDKLLLEHLKVEAKYFQLNDLLQILSEYVIKEENQKKDEINRYRHPTRIRTDGWWCKFSPYIIINFILCTSYIYTSDDFIFVSSVCWILDEEVAAISFRLVMV